MVWALGKQFSSQDLEGKVVLEHAEVVGSRWKSKSCALEPARDEHFVTRRDSPNTKVVHKGIPYQVWEEVFLTRHGVPCRHRLPQQTPRSSAPPPGGGSRWSASVQTP
jgi:hypothetical protein